MSYTVLARRYRSGTFDEVIGQSQVALTLKNAIATGRIAHAFLFCGTRGTGKTSMARILAKALNCQASDGPTPQPCGKCDSCLSIARGDDIDVIEIDAASNNGVDNVRELIANSSYRPARGRLKVYIVDEAHMLSKPAFNALLKTLEEPPSHVKFILATTEPEKLLPTIISRCQRYDFRNIAAREIAEHLRAICKQENVQADDAALRMVARAGAGSMRDALSLLDRLLSVGQTQITAETIEQLLGLPRAQLVFDLVDAIGKGDTRAVLTQADTMLAGGMAGQTLVESLVEHLRTLLVLRVCGGDTGLVEPVGQSLAELLPQAERFEPAVLTQDITILQELRRQMGFSIAPRAILDATLVRLALSDQFVSMGELLAGVSGQGEASGRPRPAASRPAAALEQKKKPEPAVTAPAIPAVADDDDDLPRPGKVWDNSGPPLTELLRQQAAAAERAASPPSPPAPNIEPVDPADLSGVQKALLEALAAKGQALHAMLASGQYVGLRDNKAVIRYTQQHETFVRMFEKNGKKEQLRETISQVIGKEVGVSFEVDPTPPKPAAALPARQRHQPAVSTDAPSPPALTVMQVRPTPEQIEALKTAEPLIRALIEQMGAQVVKIE